jgi:effector-binding domain-containing protein
MFESLIMQATSDSTVGNIVAIVVAIGAIATTLSHFLSSNSKFQKYGQYLTTFGQKTVEQEQNIPAIGSVVTNISPDAKALLDKYAVRIAELKQRAEISESQLRVLSGNIPANAQADMMKNLPR